MKGLINLKDNEKAASLIAELKALAENDFELHRISVLERDLTAPPVVEVIDDKHQKFNGNTYCQVAGSKHLARNNFIHRVIFQYYYGEIPDGYEIHHNDHNPLNNDITNLQMLTKAEHQQLHRKTATQNKCICEYCGNIFTSNRQESPRFCSRRCQSKWHYYFGKKYQKICPICNTGFETPYKHQKYCSTTCKGIAQKQATILF